MEGIGPRASLPALLQSLRFQVPNLKTEAFNKSSSVALRAAQADSARRKTPETIGGTRRTRSHHRGESPFSVLYPLAQLGKARAMKDKREYELFFKMWKDADKDLPVLIAAEKEYNEL